MSRTLRLTCLIIASLGMGIASFAADALAYFQNLPATNPYRDVLLRIEQLPPAERENLKKWIDPTADATAPALTTGQRELLHEITLAVVAASAKPPATADDWPVLPNPDDPDNPAAIAMPGIGRLRELAKMVVKTADELPAGEASDAYAAVAQLGRQQRGGATLIEQLAGMSVEGIALSGVSRRLSELSPDELRHLSDSWSKLHPIPSNEQAFAGERDLFFRPILENVIRPGLHALVAEEADAAGLAGDSPETSAPASGFTRDLRLSGLVDLGGSERQISLENVVTKTTFTLREGATVEGIELVTLNFEQRQAIIRSNGREAVINLQSKRIVERRQAADKLRKLLAGSDLLNGSGTGASTLAAVLKKLRAHPGGVDAYVNELMDAYQRGIDEQLEAAASPFAKDAAKTPPDDPFMALMAPSFSQVARSLNNFATQPDMLQAAIHHRLSQLGRQPASAPRDPWSENDTGFALETTPDGGFLLRSRYELKPGKPVTYKFAAPDAGFVRLP